MPSIVEWYTTHTSYGLQKIRYHRWEVRIQLCGYSFTYLCNILQHHTIRNCQKCIRIVFTKFLCWVVFHMRTTTDSLISFTPRSRIETRKYPEHLWELQCIIFNNRFLGIEFTWECFKVDWEKPRGKYCFLILWYFASISNAMECASKMSAITHSQWVDCKHFVFSIFFSI